MPRAIAVFRNVGIDAVASPTDYIAVDRGERVMMDFLPDAGSLLQTTSFIREIVGIFYYKLNGWVDSL
jgi:uncharacterized SAM-binding protein YcdF (DUF218 family)